MHCVARYIIEIDTILCGNPEIPWVTDNDILTDKQRREKSDAGQCTACPSINTALDRMIGFRARIKEKEG